MLLCIAFRGRSHSIFHNQESRAGRVGKGTKVPSPDSEIEGDVVADLPVTVDKLHGIVILRGGVGDAHGLTMKGSPGIDIDIGTGIGTGMWVGVELPNQVRLMACQRYLPYSLQGISGEEEGGFWESGPS